MEISLALACLAMTAATFIFVFYFDHETADAAAPRSRLDQMLERRDAIYENLRDLKFEHRAGKYSDADYEELKAALESEAAVVLAEIEKITGGMARQTAAGPGRPVRREPPTSASPL
jgi:hypothetical protein